MHQLMRGSRKFARGEGRFQRIVLFTGEGGKRLIFGNFTLDIFQPSLDPHMQLLYQFNVL